jgi:hypothetical protein
MKNPAAPAAKREAEEDWGKAVTELERKHLVETDRHIAECEAYIAKTVPNAAPHESKVEDFAHSPVPQSQPTTTTPIWPFSSSRAYRWPRGALRTPRFWQGG